MIDGTSKFVKFIWDNKEIIFSDKNIKRTMDSYYKDLSWENISYGTAKHPKVISDIGAHHGEFSIAVAQYFSNSKIYSYEPILSNIREFKNKIPDKYNPDSYMDTRFTLDYIGEEFKEFLELGKDAISKPIKNGRKVDLDYFHEILNQFYKFLCMSKSDGVWGHKLKRLNISVESINLKDLQIFNFGLWSEDKEMEIGIPDGIYEKNEECSGLFSVLHPDGLQAEKIIMKDIKSLPERPELVKIDIEGSEWEILNNCGNYFDETKIMLVEIVKESHPNFNNHDKIPSLLKSWGFIEIDTPDGSDNKLYGRI